jgi:protein SCO1/2
MRVLLTLLTLASLALSACQRQLASPQDVDVRGILPALDVQMTNAATGQPLTQAALRGHTILLYFGYTHCPDVCPATLFDLTRIEKRMGKSAANIIVLFVTVDPDRDSAPLLAQYTAIFGANVIGLRGNADQLTSLARLYRVAYTVTKTPVYTVAHSSSIYVFNAQGEAEMIIAGLNLGHPDIDGISKDLTAIADE